MQNEITVNIITCEHKEGTAKSSGKPYSFYTGDVFMLGGVVQYQSSVPFEANIAKPIRVAIKLKEDLSGKLRVELSAPTKQ